MVRSETTGSAVEVAIVTQCWSSSLSAFDELDESMFSTLQTLVAAVCSCCSHLLIVIVR